MGNIVVKSFGYEPKAAQRGGRPAAVYKTVAAAKYARRDSPESVRKIR